MQTINVCETFGLDLSDESTTRKYALSVPEMTDNHISVNLSRCIIDYTATSIFMDAIINSVTKQASEKYEIDIHFNAPFHERLLLKWLFFGSKILSLDESVFNEEEFREKISSELSRKNIALRLIVPSNKESNTLVSINVNE